MSEFKPGDIVHVIPDELDNIASLEEIKTEAVVVRDIETGSLFYVMLEPVIRGENSTPRAYAYPLVASCIRSTKREAIQAIAEKEIEWGRGIIEQANKIKAMLGD